MLLLHHPVASNASNKKGKRSNKYSSIGAHPPIEFASLLLELHRNQFVARIFVKNFVVQRRRARHHETNQMLLRMNGSDPIRFLSSQYLLFHAHAQSRRGLREGSFGAIAMTAIPTSSVELHVPSGTIRLLSSTSTPLIKMMMDAIEMQRNKTHRLLGLESLSSNDWDEIESLLAWWASQESIEGLDWAWKILDRLVLEFSSKNINENGMESKLKAKMTTWLNLTINSWRLMVIDSQSETTTSNEPPLMRAEKVLDKLDSIAPHILPDAQTNNMIIDAKIIQDPFKAPQFAEQMLEIMHRESSSNRLVEPDLVAYNSVINAWSKSGLRDAGEKSEVLLQRMEELGLKPDRISFTSVISAWANSNDPTAGQRADLLLRRMLELCKQGNDDMHPNTITYNSVIDAWAKSGDLTAGKKAESLLSELAEQYNTGNDDTKPNTLSYNSAITAWANSRDDKAGARAEALLKRMLEQREMGHEDVKPNTTTYSAAITAWANSGDSKAGMRSEALLKQMQEQYKMGNCNVKPNSVTFNSIVAAWAKSRDPNAGMRSEALLKRMEEQYKMGNEDVKPNKLSYSSAITAWANSRDPNAGMRAEALLKRMEEQYKMGNRDVKPNTLSYSSAITAWANSRDPYAGTRADALNNTKWETATSSPIL